MLNCLGSIGAGVIGAVVGGIIAFIGITTVVIKYIVMKKKK